MFQSTNQIHSCFCMNPRPLRCQNGSKDDWLLNRPFDIDIRKIQPTLGALVMKCMRILYKLSSDIFGLMVYRFLDVVITIDLVANGFYHLSDGHPQFTMNSDESIPFTWSFTQRPLYQLLLYPHPNLGLHGYFKRLPTVTNCCWTSQPSTVNQLLGDPN